MKQKDHLLELLGHAQPGHTLPQPFYRDADVYEFDVSQVFPRSWLLLGFEAELPEPGCYATADIGPHSVLMVRGKDSVIRAFHNTCRHRGARLCSAPSGRMPRIVCPYHKWTYALDGRLVGAARMPADFDRDRYPLVPIRVEVLEGCIYGALTSEVPDFAPFRAAATPYLQTYRLGQTRVAHTHVMIEKANWKLVMENARECYHCSAWHPELAVAFPVGLDAAAEGSQDAAFTSQLAGLGLPSGAVAGPWWHVSRYPLNPGIETVSESGRLVVSQHRLPEAVQAGIGGLRWATEPNTFCQAFADYAFIFTAIPTGPQETRVVSKWLVPKQAQEAVDYSLAELTSIWIKTNLQDRELAENNQKGVNNLGYRPGPYSPNSEELVIRFSHWYQAAVKDALVA